MTPFTVRSNRPHGIALVTTLLIILVLSLLAISLFHSSTTQGKNAGSIAEHQRALRVAEDALRYGEWLLVQPTAVADLPNCTTVVDLDVTPTPTSCQNVLAAPTNPPWPAGMVYTPRGMRVQAGGGLVQNQGDINYARRPMLYIHKLGVDPNNTGNTLYQVTAAGFGGRVDSVSVVQSVVSVGGS